MSVKVDVALRRRNCDFAVAIEDVIVRPVSGIDRRHRQAAHTYSQPAAGVYRDASMIEHEFVAFELDHAAGIDVGRRTGALDPGGRSVLRFDQIVTKQRDGSRSRTLVYRDPYGVAAQQRTAGLLGRERYRENYDQGNANEMTPTRRASLRGRH